MEKLELKTSEFDNKIELRCQGRCSGACQCPTGHCRCKSVDSKESDYKDSYNMPSADSDYFLKAA
jgi:hypothetical protein